MKTRRYRSIQPTPRLDTAEHSLRSLPRRRAMDDVDATYLLRTLGHPALARRGEPVTTLRRKDLALLAYLCVESPRVHARGRLAALLWGESDEGKARHSLTQALGRIQRATEGTALVVERETVRAAGGVTCDADLLLGRAGEPDELVSAYEGPFLEGFEAGFGSEDFDEWAARRRAELRNLALRRLDGRGEAAEAARGWSRALHLGERAVRIDPVWERGHRRVMRALLELGDCNHALRHYAEFRQWLAEEVGSDPDPDTRALAAHIRAAPSRAPTPPPAAAREPEPPPPRPPTATFVPPPRPIDRREADEDGATADVDEAPEAGSRGAGGADPGTVEAMHAAGTSPVMPTPAPDASGAWRKPVAAGLAVFGGIVLLWMGMRAVGAERDRP